MAKETQKSDNPEEEEDLHSENSDKPENGKSGSENQDRADGKKGGQEDDKGKETEGSSIQFDGDSPEEFLETVGVDLQDPAVQDAILSEEQTLREIAEKYGDKTKLEKLLAGSSEEEEEQEEEEEEAPTKSEGFKAKKINYRPRDEEDAAFVAFAKARGISLSEAARLYSKTFEDDGGKEGDDKGGKTATKQNAPADDPIAKLGEDISALEKEIEETEQAIDAANEELEFGEAGKLQRKLNGMFRKQTQLEIQRARAEDRAEMAKQNGQAQFDQAKASSEQAAIAKYPELGQPKSMQARAFKSFYQERYEEDPDAFDDPTWPEQLAEEFAKEAGLSPSGGKKTTQNQSTAGTKARRTTSRTDLLDGGKGGHQAPSADESAANMSDDDMDAMFEEINKLPPNKRDAAKAKFFNGFKTHRPKVRGMMQA